MPSLADSIGSKTRVNVLKKVKVNGQWKFCPIVVEPSGRLRDRVQVNGKPEAHSEGVYYIEWREAGQRRREAISNRNEVLERARLKALELDARKAGISFESGQRLPAGAPELICPSAIRGGASSDPSSLLLQGIEVYLQQAIGRFLGPHFAVDKLDEGLGESAPLIPLQPGNKAQLAQVRDREAPPNDEDASHHGKTLIADAIASYLKDVEPPQREQKTYDEYRSVLHRFRDNCGKLHLAEINRDDCLSFMRHLYSIGNEARTVYNRIGIVLQLLKLHGITGLLKGRDKPKYVENVREMYQPADLEALFKACTPDERVPYLFLLLTGERDKEVRYTTWTDIDFARKCVRVTAKKQLGFKPKDKEEREIPVPASLLAALKEHKARQSGPNPHNLVFPTGGGRPDKKFENKLKRIARRAGLNCGHCVSKHGNKCAEGPHCGKWFLHKFRHTFATASLESGVSIRTLQEWLGHSDLASTMVYLKFVGRKDIHKLLDSSQMAELAAQSLGLTSAASDGEADA